jgi:capsular polysaccharide biosynthesis protein
MFQNVIADKFTMEGPWKRDFFFRLKRKVKGFDHCRKLLNGALYEQSGHIIYESIRKSGIFGDQVISIAPIIIDPNTKVSEVIKGKSAYLGNLYSHYGHFITEGLSRFHEFEKLNEFDHILFSPYVFDYPNTQVQSYHKFFFDELKIDSSKIRILYDTVRLEQVTVFKQLWTLNDSVDPKICTLYEYLRSIEPKITYSGRRIFCSRRKPDRILNQSQLEDLFRSNGFEVIFPENLSIDEQMAIYKGDNLIVSSSGSTMHNILFGRRNSMFVEIGDQRTPDCPHIMQQLVNSLAVANYRFIPFSSKDGKNWELKVLQDVINSL